MHRRRARHSLCWVARASGLAPKTCTRPSAAPRANGCAESMQNIYEVPGLVRASKAASPIALPPPRALPDSRCAAEGSLRKRAADRPAALHSWLLPHAVAFRIALFEPRGNFNPSVALADSVVLRWRGGYAVDRLLAPSPWVAREPSSRARVHPGYPRRGALGHPGVHDAPS